MSESSTNRRGVSVTVEGVPFTREITLKQVREYLTRAGWERHEETASCYEMFTAGLDPAVMDPHNLYHAVIDIARHEKRHPAEVLREIAGGDVGAPLDIDTIEARANTALAQQDPAEPHGCDELHELATPTLTLVAEVRRLRFEKGVMRDELTTFAKQETRITEEAAAWKALAVAYKMELDADYGHPELVSPARLAQGKTLADLRALGIDPDAPEGT